MSLTPPVVRGKFAYVNDSFLAKSSNDQPHGRASIPDLKALFQPSGKKNETAVKDQTAHWFEAQLLHYGLQPSKQKAVAKMRLLDAVNSGKLVVPDHIRKLEDEMKKEWVKNDRAAKKQSQPPKPAAKPKTAVTTATAKKQSQPPKLAAKPKTAITTATVKKTQGAKGAVASEPKSAKGPAKKRATNVPPSPPLPSQAPSRKPAAKKNANDAPRGNSQASQQDSIKPAARAGQKNPQTNKSSRATEPKRTIGTTAKRATNVLPEQQQPVRQFSRKQTARKSASNVPRDESPPPAAAKRKRTQEASHAASPAKRPKQATESAPKGTRTEQTARYSGPPRGGASVRGRVPQTVSRATSDVSADAMSWQAQEDYYEDGYKNANSDDSANPYQYDSYDKQSEDSENSYDETSHHQSVPLLGPLGLINGTYSIDSEDLDEWPDMFDAHNFSLILCLEGQRLWGAYEFGMHSGIMYLPERPWQSSHEPLRFEWRGRENSEGQMSFGPGNEGQLWFYGDGKIEGMINCYGRASFRGERISGAETRAPRDARSMRQEWDSYNQEAYDRANRARWGGSGW